MGLASPPPPLLPRRISYPWTGPLGAPAHRSQVGYPPFTSENPTGGSEGFSFDLASEIAERIGRSGTKLVIRDFLDIFDGRSPETSR